MKPLTILTAALSLTMCAERLAAGPIYEFTNATAIGRLGPTQALLDAAYASTTLAGQVTATGLGIQNWTVATTGTYRVTVAGAQGASGDPSFVGGFGAMVSGDFFFNSGSILQIVVGQMGLLQSSTTNGGGGGGSFVVDALNNPLIIAGGGGGTRTSVTQNGNPGVVSNFGTTASGSAPSGGGLLKSTGLGVGGIASSNSWGSGGAGFFGNGANDSSWGTGGSSWANGMLGGDKGSGSGADAEGGFGGGGSGNGSYGGGGGGGYSGGDGGRVAGGGGSFNLGADPAGSSGFNDGHGYVTIELKSSASVPDSGDTGSILALVLSGLVVARRASLRRELARGVT